MNTLLPDFEQAIFEEGDPVDNPYFPLTPGTILAYQGEKYELAEIIQPVAAEIGSEITEEILEELDGENNFENNEPVDEAFAELAKQVEAELNESIVEMVNEVTDELGDFEIEPEELAEEITQKLSEDITEEFTGEESDETNYSLIIEELDNNGLSQIANEIAEEITEAQADLFGTESNQVFVTYDTKNILGVETIVVRDVAWDEGVLVEDTFDWYAQDTEGNVWYLGEIATNYEYDEEGNFIGTNNDGSWEAGVNGALPGYLMKADPQVGDRYYQEFSEGIAEDEGEVVGLNQTISTNFGEFENVLKTLDFTQLEPDTFAYKYYAPGIGTVLEEEGITENGAEVEISPELVSISEIPNITLPALSTATFENSAEITNLYFPLNPGTFFVYAGEDTQRQEILVTNDTRNILGITTRVVREQEFADNMLEESTLYYYAQDTEGNVWLLGETVIEYEYDEEGDLIETDDSDSWLAGEDQSIPGFIMPGNPEIGQSYYQRFALAEAEDQGEIFDLDAVIPDIGNYNNVLQIKEFSPLEPDEFDYVYYAPGVGEVFTQELNQDGETIFTSSLVSVTDIGG
ncbi:hypothetical protein [Gloeocapsa sp. PCC 73106]|uniref:hypothetical protein n=1 Tax=Gloeocapsa sp. PCC 73106 TaxID=102232 RepID=UPI0002AB9A7A|nr:hypothetical protein [Gloeocapsa sp. PCC 73106]ELR96509.1 hypothetical protein GLO73106DRAFT_00003030 [Gloeocapsa sp. PCC 73106]